MTALPAIMRRRPNRSPRARAASTVSAAILASGLVLAGHPQAAHSAPVTRVDLRVLVVSDGSPMVGALEDRLARQGVPTTTVRLDRADRPRLTQSFLTVADRAGPHAKFQGVILPSSAPAELSALELATLHSYEAAFGVRQVDAYVYPTPDLGLNWPAYSGPVDGMTGSLSAEATNDGFAHLRGTVPLDDNDGSVTESWGYLASVGAPVAGTSFTPLLTAPIPGSGEAGVLMGVRSAQGREELVTTFASNASQQHLGILAPGVINWVTRGVHLGQFRNYFSAHVDDVLLPDALWNIEGNCTPGAGCDPIAHPEDSPGATTRMTAGDVTRLVTWQRDKGLELDMAFNGDGTSQYVAEHGTADPLLTALKANKSQLRWLNHTWSHPYLGCVQDYTVTPWVCAKDSSGTTRYASRTTISSEISKNVAFARNHGLTMRNAELVTGEHSGLRTLPQMPADNPNLAPALTGQNIRWIASDASREPQQRKIGSALTVPRYPMNIFYNAATKEQEVDEYNWIYTSRADGGSGLCEDNPATSTCITPLDLTTGFDERIAPLEARIAFGHVLGNDPRPHYAHQSNLAEDGILYPVLDRLLDRYRQTFATNTPLVVPTMTEAGTALSRSSEWRETTSVTGTIVGDKVVLRTSSGTVTVPVTTPAGTRQGFQPFGASYAGRSSDWVSLTWWTGPVTLSLPGPTAFKAPSTWTAPTTVPVAPAPPAASTTDATDGGTTTEVTPPNALDGLADTAEQSTDTQAP